jgi:hypothetical protein
MKATELNHLRRRARSRRRIQNVYILTLATCTLLLAAIVTASILPLLCGLVTSIAGLITVYRDEQIENEYRNAVRENRK